MPKESRIVLIMHARDDVLARKDTLQINPPGTHKRCWLIILVRSSSMGWVGSLFSFNWPPSFSNAIIGLVLGGQAQLISYSIAASDDQIVEEKKNIHTKLSLSLSFHKTKGKTFKNQKKQKKKNQTLNYQDLRLGNPLDLSAAICFDTLFIHA